MAKIAIIVGTTMGGAEAVADELELTLNKAGHQCQLTLSPEAKEMEEFPTWLIVTSTHGAGDLPDNLISFHDELSRSKPDLNAISFALCGIGDSSYDTFCGALNHLDPLLRSLGAKPIVDKLRIDVKDEDLPESQAIKWLSNHIELFTA